MSFKLGDAEYTYDVGVPDAQGGALPAGAGRGGAGAAGAARGGALAGAGGGGG